MPMLKTHARLLAAAALAATTAGIAYADDARMPGDHVRPVRMGPAGHDHPAGGPMMGSGPMGIGSPRELHRLLERVSATEAQRSQVRDLLQAARTDLQAQRQAGAALRDEQMKILTQPTVDANAAEAVRQKMLAQHDEASKRQLALLLDVSRVFTPEQRAKLAGEMDQMRQRRDLAERQAAERRELERSQKPSN